MHFYNNVHIFLNQRTNFTITYAQTSYIIMLYITLLNI